MPYGRGTAVFCILTSDRILSITMEHVRSLSSKLMLYKHDSRHILSNLGTIDDIYLNDGMVQALGSARRILPAWAASYD